MMTENKSALTTREVRAEDWGRIAALVNQYENDGVTAEIMLARSNRWTDGDPRLQLVMVDASGEVVGHARSLRRSSDPAGKFSTTVYVDQKRTGQGLGRELLAAVEAHAIQNGAKFLTCYVPESCERGVRFAGLNGYLVSQHLFGSKVELTGFDAAPYLGRKAELEKSGYRFTTLEKEGVTEEHLRRLYSLDVDTDVDTPGFENWGKRSYEQYLRDEHESHGFTPAGVFIAEFDGEWVAVSAVRPMAVEGHFHIDYTGVRRGHRGKGLAQVLKALAMRFAQEEGAQVLETNNDERNAPMLRINQKMGFVPESGFYVCRKELSNE